MSFLNPVNEPVLRFSSTDADAPQINYNARTAGDVKTVLKACLVTGYGAKASAGWSVVNETEHVAEFVSPSVAMSDYRLGIDDTSTSSTTWYYQYQNVRNDPARNSIGKSIAQIDKTHTSNGWQLLATERGLVLVEYFYSTFAQALSSRVTYWGQAKAAVNLTSKNIAFWCEGHSAQDYSYKINNSSKHYVLDNLIFEKWFAAVPLVATDVADYTLGVSNIDMQSAVYLTSSSGIVLGQQPGVMLSTINTETDMFDVRDVVIMSRQALHLCLGYHGNASSSIYSRSRNMLIYLDYWEY